MILLLILLKCLKHQRDLLLILLKHDHYPLISIGKDVFVVVGVGPADDVVGVTAIVGVALVDVVDGAQEGF